MFIILNIGFNLYKVVYKFVFFVGSGGGIYVFIVKEKEEGGG